MHFYFYFQAAATVGPIASSGTDMLARKPFHSSMDTPEEAQSTPNEEPLNLPSPRQSEPSPSQFSSPPSKLNGTFV